MSRECLVLQQNPVGDSTNLFLTEVKNFTPPYNAKILGLKVNIWIHLS